MPTDERFFAWLDGELAGDEDEVGVGESLLNDILTLYAAKPAQRRWRAQGSQLMRGMVRSDVLVRAVLGVVDQDAEC